MCLSLIACYGCSEVLFHHLAEYCDEFLVHAVDVEGKRCGILVLSGVFICDEEAMSMISWFVVSSSCSKSLSNCWRSGRPSPLHTLVVLAPWYADVHFNPNEKSHDLYLRVSVSCCLQDDLDFVDLIGNGKVFETNCDNYRAACLIAGSSSHLCEPIYR